MTPQEKAIQLVDHFMDLSEEQEYNTPRYMTKEMAIQCALIAVNEIINSEKFIWGGYNRDEYRRYFQEVKIEIEKL
jgi:hypothetical protein